MPDRFYNLYVSLTHEIIHPDHTGGQFVVIVKIELPEAGDEVFLHRLAPDLAAAKKTVVDLYDAWLREAVPAQRAGYHWVPVADTFREALHATFNRSHTTVRMDLNRADGHRLYTNVWFTRRDGRSAWKSVNQRVSGWAAAAHPIPWWCDRGAELEAIATKAPVQP